MAILESVLHQFLVQSYGRLHFKNLLASPLLHCSLGPVKPCPGVPCIHPDADSTASRTAAHRCGAGRHLCTKFRRCNIINIFPFIPLPRQALNLMFFIVKQEVHEANRDGTNSILSDQRDLKRVETPYPLHYRSSALSMRTRWTCKEWKTSQTFRKSVDDCEIQIIRRRRTGSGGGGGGGGGGSWSSLRSS